MIQKIWAAYKPDTYPFPRRDELIIGKKGGENERMQQIMVCTNIPVIGMILRARRPNSTSHRILDVAGSYILCTMSGFNAPKKRSFFYRSESRSRPSLFTNQRYRLAKGRAVK